jgi:tetraacyldisaccharide 4'-kinase
MASAPRESYLALLRGERRGVGARLLRAGLWWASLPYRAAVGLRNQAFDRGWKKVQRVPVPVVCVGNLTLGGTGKTPCVEYVARFYRELGLAVAILSRGYGAEAGPNDEALLLEENLPDVPHLQGPDRAAIARTAVEELESEILVLDDGFQHRRLHRDLDIVLLDATRPISQEFLLPRGFLREPTSGLKRANFAIFTRCDQTSAESLNQQIAWLKQHHPQLPFATSRHEPMAMEGRSLPTPDEWRTRPVAAFCGLGNPGSFRRTLEHLGATLTDFRTYADHHNYTRADVESLQSWAKALPANTIVATTQKDWVKLRIDELGGKPLVAIRVGLTFQTGEDAFRGCLQSVAPAPREWAEDYDDAEAA